MHALIQSAVYTEMHVLAAMRAVASSVSSATYDPLCWVQCSYASRRQSALEAERRDALASQLDYLGLYPCKGSPYMPLLVTAVVHKVCRFS